jgi:phenylalanyl-tRNA synthetase beta chain
MNLEKQNVVEIANPKVQTLTCLRNWLIPNLMDFLSNNLHVEYPQRIFELGKTTVPDERKETRTRDEETLAAAISHANASFSETKSFLDAFFTNIGMPWRIEEAKHPSFIEGRMGTVVVDRANIGIMGEITPRVLEAWKLENPTAAFELNMEKIVRIKQTSS